MKDLIQSDENQVIKNKIDVKINFFERSSCLSIAFLKTKA